MYQEGDNLVTAPSHTRHVFEVQNFPLLVEWVVGLARENGYEALAACGHSGLLVAAAAGYVLRVPIIAVRKAKDFAKGDSSSVNAVLPHRPLRYAIVDDFVSSGETVNRIVTQIADQYPALQLAAILLHEQNSATTAGKLLEWTIWEDVFAGAIVHSRLGAFDHPELDTTYAVERQQAAAPLLESAQPVAAFDLSSAYLTLQEIAAQYPAEPELLSWTQDELMVPWDPRIVVDPKERKAP